MSKMPGRSHNLTFGIAFIISCVVMLLYFLNLTHEKLESSREALEILEKKYGNVVKQFDSLFEYKERLENSFKNFKELKAPSISETETLKSELAVLKGSHKTEIQRLHDELDACRRREEMAVVNSRASKDEALSPPSLSAQSPSVPISPVEDVLNNSKDHDQQDHNSGSGVKVINTLRNFHSYNNTAGVTRVPSMDPNLDLAGNVMV